MPLYHCHLIDYGGNILGTGYFEAEDDAAAIAQGLGVNAKVIEAGVELWQGDRFVYSHRNRSSLRC